METPKVEVIISLYNYEKYIKQCLDSICMQDYAHLAINIVDDGSTDKSVAIVEEYCRKNPAIKLIKQQNNGQLSAFNTAVTHLDNDSEIILFLDADDYMQKGYIKKAVQSFRDYQCDMLFCESTIDENGRFYDNEKSVLPFGDLGFCIFDTYYNRSYYGNSTSTIALQRTMLDKILPLPLESEWKIRADDCIIYGAALVGAKIYHLDFKGIYYRIHNSNNHCGKTFDSKYEFHRLLHVQKLFATLMARHKIMLSYDLFCAELESKPKELFARYKKMVRQTDFKFFEKWRAHKIVRKKLKGRAQ